MVGDLKFYGKYFNYGPLPQGRDFHISLGAVSTLNNVTKASYAKVNHGQHAKNNLIGTITSVDFSTPNFTTSEIINSIRSMLVEIKCAFVSVPISQ